MDAIAQLSTAQKLIIVALYAWVFIIFPVMVLRKLNYLTSLLESKMDNEPSEK